MRSGDRRGRHPHLHAAIGPLDRRLCFTPWTLNRVPCKGFRHWTSTPATSPDAANLIPGLRAATRTGLPPRQAPFVATAKSRPCGEQRNDDGQSGSSSVRRRPASVADPDRTPFSTSPIRPRSVARRPNTDPPTATPDGQTTPGGFRRLNPTSLDTQWYGSSLSGCAERDAEGPVEQLPLGSFVDVLHRHGRPTARRTPTTHRQPRCQVGRV